VSEQPELDRPAPPDVDRVAAAKAAVAARQARAAIKHDIAAKNRTALDVAQSGWDDPASAEAGIRVTQLLTSIPGLGPAKMAAVLDDLGTKARRWPRRASARETSRVSHRATGCAALATRRARRPDRGW